MTRSRFPLALLAVATLALAGCTGSSSPEAGAGSPDLQLGSDQLGGIRGVAVDEALRPLANVAIGLDTGASALTDAEGLFTFVDLEPRIYVVTATKAGHERAQLPAPVEAGDTDPDVLRLVLPRIPGKEPYSFTHKMDGVYECTFSGPFIVDSCDMAVRTAYDAVNETAPPPFPRQVQNNHNTEFIALGDDVEAIVQEAFWDDPNVPEMMISLSSTPIDNACDCSEKDYLEAVGPSPTYGRLDKEGNAGFPVNATVAVRGFLPFGENTVATGLRFTVLTTVFIHYSPPEGWTYETRADYPL